MRSLLLVSLLLLAHVLVLGVSGELILLNKVPTAAAGLAAGNNGSTYQIVRNATAADLTPLTVVQAVYNKTFFETGWDYLYVEPNRQYFQTGSSHGSKLEAYRAAGYLEGYSTGDRIWDAYVDTVVPYCIGDEFAAEKAFIEEHMMYMSKELVNSPKNSAERKGEPKGFVDQLEKIWAQMEGIYEGYNDYIKSLPAGTATGGGNMTKPQALDMYQVFLLSYNPEFPDVQTYVTATKKAPLNHRITKNVFGQHCSAFIKPTFKKNGQGKMVLDDLFVAHDTWDFFGSMIRQYKIYAFETTVAMSSYPGMLASSDDWYMTSKQLAVEETTSGLWNNTLYVDYFVPTKVSEWIRVMIANYLTSSGKEWTTYFVWQNSGSYNNEWMVVDMKLFKPGTRSIPDNLLWISETLPGYAKSADVSHVVRKDGYWASYNIPYFKEIFDLSGNLMMQQQYGSFFSYTDYARPLIFARNQSSVKSLEDMKALMRYNGYHFDPLSDIPNCTGTIYGHDICKPKRSAQLSVACRGDLDPAPNASTMGPLAPMGFVGTVNNGAIDSKIASYKNMQKPEFVGVAISGPTTSEGLPPFAFSAAPKSIGDQPHQGMPDKWDFPWMEYSVPPRQSSSTQPPTQYVRLSWNTSDPATTEPNLEPLETTFMPDSVALLEHNATMNVTGWDTVTVTINPLLLAEGGNASLGYYGAGYLEGYYTAETIYNNYYNLELPEFSSSTNYSGSRAWILEQIEYMRSLSQVPDPEDVPVAGYGSMLGKILSQMEGLTAGYNKYVTDMNGLTFAQPLKLQELYLLSFQTEMWDVETYVMRNPGPPGSPPAFGSYSRTALRNPRNMRQHCSAIIKPTADDLFVSHTTWANYNSMLRQYKTYNFETIVSMSSYPGMLVSSDDWYITSNGLAVIETSNAVYNLSLYNPQQFSTSTVCAWIRTMLATYMGTTARHWQDVFLYKNSGTYNNQWMAVNMNIYQVGTAPSDLPDDLFWISETLPGHGKSADVTHVLREQGYWASYNIPYFTEIYDASGNLMMEQEYGTYFSYSEYARPKIFARNQSAVTDLEGVKALMRYNGYQFDPLSDIPNCTGTIFGDNTCEPKRSALLSIASRGDLDPPANVSTMGPLASSSVGGVGLANLGDLDCKIASYSQMMLGGNFYGTMQSGPSTSGGTLPVFDFDTAPDVIKNSPHVGLPARFAFPWMRLTPSALLTNSSRFPSGGDRPSSGMTQKTKSAIVGAIIGALGAILLIAIIALVIRHRRYRSFAAAHHVPPGSPASEGSPLRTPTVDFDKV